MELIVSPSSVFCSGKTKPPTKSDLECGLAESRILNSQELTRKEKLPSL